MRARPCRLSSRRADAEGGTTKPVALITAFSNAVLPRILAEIAAGPQPPLADWYVGSYGVNRDTAKSVADTPGCSYAPVFAIQPSTSMQARERRRVPKEIAAKLPHAHSGMVPGTPRGNVLPGTDRRAWGVELGCRFRDAVRAARAARIDVATWQFDEILSQCAASSGHREFVGGALAGLSRGRPELEEGREQGFVWAARRAMTRLPLLTITPELRRFWEAIDGAALFLVGEEYPPFQGDPGAGAREYADVHRALVRSSGTVRRALGRRYIAGLSPGWRPEETGLGGNVDGKPLSFVTSWRSDFIDARIEVVRPRGFAQFNFRVENVKPKRLEDAVRSLHHASAQLAE